MEIENELFMSQEGYASIDFTLLDRPNNNIASAPEATAVLLPDVHASESSFAQFELLDGSGVVGSYGYPREVDENQPLEQSRDGTEDQTMHSNADNGVAASNVDYPEYQMPQPVPKPVSNVDFFAKNQTPQQQEQQAQLTLFGGDVAEESQEYFESGQAPQQSQPTPNSWWMPDNTWMANNNQRDQSQVYNWAAMTEDQRRSMQLKMGGSQNSSQSDYPGALYTMPQAVNSDPTPSMYSFLPTNTNQLHKLGQPADAGLSASRVQAVQNSTTEKSPQYDFQGLLNGSGYQHAGTLAQNMSLSEQQRYRTMVQEASSREQQLRMQEARSREQQLRMQEANSREQQLRLQEANSREQQLRLQEANSREQQLRLQEANSREQQLRLQEASSREQQLRLHGQQSQSFSKYDSQNIIEAPLKVSDYDFLGGGDYMMKGQPHAEVRQQLDEGEAQIWRQQPPARQPPRQFSAFANNSFDDLHQRQQAQVRQRLQQHAHQQQLFAGSQNQASGNQFQAFLSEGSIQDLPQVMQQQPERVSPQQMGIEGHHSFVQPNLQGLNHTNAGNLMYSSNHESGGGQGPAIGYLLGQDNSFSWHQLAMKASGLDQSMHAANSSKTGQQSNPYSSVHSGAIPGFLGGMSKPLAPTAQINRPIPRSLGAGPSPLFGMEGRPAVADHQGSKAKMLFGQAMQQQQPPQAMKPIQGFSGSLHQSSYPTSTRQSLEESHWRQQQGMRGSAVQQDGTPHVKLFSQSLTSLDPMQQQQHNLMATSRNAQNQQARPVNLLQQTPVNMPQARTAHHYQPGVNQASGAFLQSANDRKQRPLWNYEMEPDSSHVEVPVVLPGSTDSMLKSNSWSAAGESHAAPDTESSLAFERTKMQQNVWGVHGTQQSSSQSSGDLGSRHHSLQSGAIIQQGTSQSTGGHPLAAQANGSIIHQNSLQSGTSMLDLSELETDGRQQELQNSQEEGNWRNHSLLQASPQQSVARNSSLQAFTDMDRAPTSWKSLWQSVQNTGNSAQLAEPEKEQQSPLWTQSNSHVAGSQPELSDDPSARMAQSGWAGAQGTLQTDASGEREQSQASRDEQQFMLSDSPQPGQGFQDDGRQQLNNQAQSFQEALSQASLSDNDPSSASRHIDQSFQNASPFTHSVERDGNHNNQNSSDPVGHSSSSKEPMHFPNFSVEHQTSLNKANLQNQGKSNAWTSDSRQRLDDTAIPVLDSSSHQEGRVQLQLSNQQAENRFSSLMNARTSTLQEENLQAGAQSIRALNAVGGYRHQHENERSTLLNGASEDAMAGWAHGQVAANQIRTEQSKLGGRALQTISMAGSAGKEYFTPPRHESAGDEHSSYTTSMLAQRARFTGSRVDRRDATDPGRNTLELLSRTEQGEKIGEGLEDPDGSTTEDGVPAAGISLAHLRRGPMGTALQRPTPSRPEFISREQVELQLSRNMENWNQGGRNLLHEFSREDARAYAQAQMQAQMQQAQSMRAAQMQAENMSRQGQAPERVAMSAAFLGANRHLPSDMSRQAAAHIYKNLSAAAKIQFAQQLAQQNQRASAAAHALEHPNMASALDPRIALQQHMSRGGYAERPAMPGGMPPDKASPAIEVAPGAPGQGGAGLPQAQPGALQQSKQSAALAPVQKKRKEYPPLIPWRITISQAAMNLPTTIRAEMEWAAATNSVPDQERFSDAAETLDVTAMCVKRAKRRLKFTTQLMQQIVPALPCQLFKGNVLDDYKSATFVLAKFVVSEACWLATGVSKEASGTAAVGDNGENSNGNVISEKSEQQVEVVKQGSPVTLSSKLKTHFTKKMEELQDELSRLESTPTALKLSRELHDLDKLIVLNRMARVHGPEFLAGASNSTGSPRGKLEAHAEVSMMYSSESAFPERFVAAVSVPQRIPDNLMLYPL